jgi:amino acid adenylation domain-containing protein
LSPAAGDSALAARLLTDVAAIGGRIWIEGEKLKVDAPSGALNEALQSRIRAQRGELVTLLSRRETGITPIVRTEGQVFPLSLHQHAFFMLDQMEPGHAALNVVSVRRIREPIDPDRFCAAVRAVALRHESLRTVFAMQAGRAVQRVVPLAAEPCTFKDLSGLDDAARRAAIASLTSRRHGAAFDLAAGPLFGLDLLSFGQADFVTCLRMHHIVSDAVSIEIFYGELIAFYHAHGKPGGPGVPPLRLHYADYAAWQDRMLRGGELDGQIDYWRRRLDGVPPLLPRLNAAAPEDGAITVHRAAAPGLRAALHRRAQALKVSPFSFLLAMFHLLLARATRSADIPVIVPVSGRARPEVQPLIGLFVSGLVLRAEVRPEQTLGDFAAGIADEVARALGAQDVSIESLEGLARQRRLPVPGLAALSKIGFNYLTPTRPPDDRLAVEVLDSDRTRSVFDMFLVAVDGPDSLSFKLEQRSGLFAAGFAERLLADFAGLVEQASGADGSAKLFAIAPRSQADICAALGATGARIWPLDAGALGLAEAPALPHHACGRALTAHGAVLTARLRAAAAIWPQLASALLRAPAPLDAAYLVARANWPEDAARSGGLCVVTHARDMLTVRLSPLIGTAADAEALAAYLAGQAPTLPDGRGATQVADAALMPASWDLPAVESLAPSRVGQEQSTDCLWLDAPAASMVRNAGSGFAGRAAILLGRIAALADPEFDNAPVCVLRDTPEGHGSVDCVAHGNGAPGLLWLMLREVIEAAASARLVAPPGGLAVEILLATDGRAALRGSSAGGIDPVATLRRFAAGLRQILGSAAPDGPLDLLLAEERRDWERLNAGWRSGLSCDVITRLRRFAEETPAGEAICADGTVLSYAAVAGAMDGIAGSLAHLGASPRAAGALRVGVMVSRGAWLPLAPLGILAAGGTYVPLDPALPDQALAAIGARLDLAAVLADAPHVARAGELFGRVLDIEAACRAEPPPLRDAPSDAPAYVMFTSGSTGQPKAVEIGRPALWSFLAAVEAAIPIRHGDRMLAVTSPGFDISLLELFLPLCGGGTVVIAAAEDVRNGEALSRQLRRHAITHLQATPSLWRLLVEAGWKGGLRLGISGGEALAPALARQLLDRCGELWNFYGPTEATVWCCFARVGAAALDAGDAPVPIGMPLANSRVYVTDPGGALVPPGVAGELLVGGDGLAGLYLGDAAKTAAAFFELPGAGRVYRTGDRACLGPAGLVWLGRKDRQVKLRGQRIELAGVEAALQALPGVREAACVLLRAGTAEALLAGFVSGRTEAALPDVRRALRSVLPPGSLPDRLFAISALPRLINGKVDYGALGELWADRRGPSAIGADDRARAARARPPRPRPARAPTRRQARHRGATCSASFGPNCSGTARSAPMTVFSTSAGIRSWSCVCATSSPNGPAWRCRSSTCSPARASPTWRPSSRRRARRLAPRRRGPGCGARRRAISPSSACRRGSPVRRRSMPSGTICWKGGVRSGGSANANCWRQGLIRRCCAVRTMCAAPR